jgi:hypothetical protein
MNARIAKEAHARMMNGETELYLWFKTLELIVASEKPEGAELAINERIPSHMTVEQLNYWFAARTGRVPYLPGD